MFTYKLDMSRNASWHTPNLFKLPQPSVLNGALDGLPDVGRVKYGFPHKETQLVEKIL